jgi:hypothetical protein
MCGKIFMGSLRKKGFCGFGEKEEILAIINVLLSLEDRL